MADLDPRRRHPKIRLAPEAYENPDALYLLTTCSHERRTAFANHRLATEAIRLLLSLRTRRRTSIYAYCLMPEHLHILLSPAPGDGVSRIIRAYKLDVTRRSWLLGCRGALWQKRFNDRILRPGDSGIGAVEYILDNPVRRGLVGRREEYPYSGTPDILDASYG